MTTPTPDLYQSLGLDPTCSSDELGLLILGRDAELDNTGVPVADPRRRRLQTAYAVLAADPKRRIYDEALAAHRPVSWQDLEHLGNFGSLPDAHQYPGPGQPGPSAFQVPPTVTPDAYGSPFAQPSGYSAGVPEYQQYGAAPAPAQDRPGAGLRLGMMLLDSIAAGMLGGLAGVLFGFNDNLAALMAAVVSTAYFIGLEAYTGATPVKHLFGYEVRDASTGARPTLEQSAKRYWWRLVGLIPVIGWIVSFVGMIVIGTSINPASGYIGAHDRWAGVEVARKRNR